MTFKLHLLNNFARLHSRGEEMKHTTTHTCTQIKKHKTNHLLMGRKVLAAAAETDGSRKKRGEKTMLVLRSAVRQTDSAGAGSV